MEPVRSRIQAVTIPNTKTQGITARNQCIAENNTAVIRMVAHADHHCRSQPNSAPRKSSSSASGVITIPRAKRQYCHHKSGGGQASPVRPDEGKGIEYCV